MDARPPLRRSRSDHESRGSTTARRVLVRKRRLSPQGAGSGSSSTWSLLVSDHEVAGQFAHVLDLCQITQIHPPGARRRGEAEAGRRNFAAGFPIVDLNAVLRTASHDFGRDVIPARIGTVALRNPDLPVDILFPERKVVAFRTT